MAVHGLAEATNHSSMAEEAEELNVLLIPHLWQAATVRDGLSVHKGMGAGLRWVRLCCLHPGMEKCMFSFGAGLCP